MTETALLSGSPPRMRGKALSILPGSKFEGITPAYAGKRSSGGSTNTIPVDHPRVCGEKSDFVIFARPAQGSPPRMRGKGRPAQGGTPATGITPAYAGKRMYPFFQISVLWDHPRVCGEKPFTAYFRAWWGGSPPRMRGKGRDGTGYRLLQRITPAYAGKRHGHPANRP